MFLLIISFDLFLVSFDIFLLIVSVDLFLDSIFLGFLLSLLLFQLSLSTPDGIRRNRAPLPLEGGSVRRGTVNQSAHAEPFNNGGVKRVIPNRCQYSVDR